MRIIFKSVEVLQGDITSSPSLGAELNLNVQIIDDDEPDANYRIDVFKDIAGGKPASSPVESFEATGDQNMPLDLEGICLEAFG